MMIYKRDFVQQLRTECGYTKKAASDLVDDFWKIFTKNVEAGNEMNFIGYGTFTYAFRPESKVTAPNGVEYDSPAHYLTRFASGARVKRALRNRMIDEVGVGELDPEEEEEIEEV